MLQIRLNGPLNNNYVTIQNCSNIKLIFITALLQLQTSIKTVSEREIVSVKRKIN